MALSERYASYQRLQFDEPYPHLLRITIASETKYNLMDPELHRELGDIWLDVDADDAVSAALLTARGESFSAGGNIKRNPDHFEFKERVRAMREAQSIVYNMMNCSKPIVSAVRGWAVGGGLACALMADISVVSKTAKLHDGHTRLGVAAGDHAAIIWPLLCGMARAKRYLLLCEPISGEEAERIGLVSMAVEDAELDDKALEVATRLAAGAPTALRWTKQTLNHWLRQAAPIFDASLALEVLGCFGPDVLEGRASLIQKRPANFVQSQLPEAAPSK